MTQWVFCSTSCSHFLKLNWYIFLFFNLLIFFAVLKKIFQYCTRKLISCSSSSIWIYKLSCCWIFKQFICSYLFKKLRQMWNRRLADKISQYTLFLLIYLACVHISPSILSILSYENYASEDEKRLNATYIISVARKLGCSIFLLPEDIMEVIKASVSSLLSNPRIQNFLFFLFIFYFQVYSPEKKSSGLL